MTHRLEKQFAFKLRTKNRQTFVREGESKKTFKVQEKLRLYCVQLCAQQDISIGQYCVPLCAQQDISMGQYCVPLCAQQDISIG